MGLDDIVNENNYPIVFIGAGISKRYLKNSMSWNDLLQEYWNKTFKDSKFYSRLHELTSKYPNLPREDQDFKANTIIAREIEKKFDELFFSESLKVTDLTTQKAQENRISPFKFDLCNKLKSYIIKDDIRDSTEFNEFKKLLSKAKIIVTTNYDSFIEDLVPDSKVYVGQEGFFDETSNWSEIYKIHGSITNQNSIVITDEDYEKYDQKSILISAKILSAMITSPIVFIGYSLTDRNVRKLLTDFSSQLPKEDPRTSANRILLVEYDMNNPKLDEHIIQDKETGLTYTSLSTDNYTEIFSKLNTINQGASPKEVRKYTSLIRKLVEVSGQKGQLESVLVSPEKLDDINDQINQGKHIVVALGDKRYIMAYPDYLSYIRNYFTDGNEYSPNIALSFVANYSNSMAKIPFSKYLKLVDFNSISLKKKGTGKN
ncbi:hypothetical protein GKC32_00490 [Lactobacillus curvatus]|nr:hypothetical protein [Latilactobacillus curvatus]MSE22952.1 hypothetical protein [Latilactobacillus curvatus]